MILSASLTLDDLLDAVFRRANVFGWVQQNKQREGKERFSLSSF